MIKRLVLTMMLVMMLVVPVSGEMFVYDSGQDVTVSWVPVAGAFYYDLTVENKSGGADLMVSPTFEAQAVLEGLVKHDIYSIEGNAYNSDGENIESMGQEFICFAVEETSSTCICNCPEIPKHIFYGTIGPNWYTGVAICNSTPENQIVLLNINDVTKAINIKASSCETALLRQILEIDVIPKQNESYAMSIDAVEGVGMTLHTTDGESFGMQ